VEEGACCAGSEGVLTIPWRPNEDSAAEVVVAAAPCDLGALLHLDKPVVRARYAFAEVGTPGLGSVVDAFLARQGIGTT